jgi:four helix bundle protein
VSKSSLTELENHFLIAKDVGYINLKQLENLQSQMNIVGRLLTGLIRSVL